MARIALEPPGVRVAHSSSQMLYLHCEGSRNAIGYNVTPTTGGGLSASDSAIAVHAGTFADEPQPFMGWRYPTLGSFAGCVEYEDANDDVPPRTV